MKIFIQTIYASNKYYVLTSITAVLYVIIKKKENIRTISRSA